MQSFSFPQRLTVGLSALFLSGMVSASSEKLEADLREGLVGDGVITFSRVYEDAQQGLYVAEGIEVTNQEGEVLTFERYTVQGDYDQPTSVSAEGIAMFSAEEAQPLISVDSITLANPGMAVLSIDALEASDYTLPGLAINGLRINLAEIIVSEWSADLPSGYLSMDSLNAEDISRHAIGLLEVDGVSADILFDAYRAISGQLDIASIRIEQLQGMEHPGQESVESASLNGASLVGEGWQVALERLWVDGSAFNGNTGFEGAYFDVAELIKLVPPSERQELQTFLDVMTDGTGQLHADAYHESRWQEESEHSRLLSEGSMTFTNAGDIAYSMDIPLVLSEGITLDDATRDSALFENALLKGGRLLLTYSDEGLLPRLASSIAVSEGISAPQVIVQMNQQAQQAGAMFGPQVQKVIRGLVDIMAGHSSDMNVSAALPKNMMFNHSMLSPMRIAEYVDIRIELK